MSSERLTAEVIGTQWMELEKSGIVGIDPIVRAITGNFDGLDNNTLTNQIHRSATHEYLYKGTRETLSKLLTMGDRIVFWTQGDPQLQAWKLATSGLSSLRKGENAIHRPNLIFFSAEDKIPEIPPLISRYSQSVNTNGDHHQLRTVIVDDKAHNIIAAQQLLTSSNIGELCRGDYKSPIDFVWMRHKLGRSKDIVPDGVSIDSLLSTFYVANEPCDLVSIRDEITRSENCLWLIDVDHTILHTEGWRNEQYRTLASALNK